MRGILLDRDGVINRERADYVKCWAEFEFLPGVLDSLKRLASLAVPIMVITNQSVIGRKIVGRHVVDEIHRKAKKQIDAAGGRIDGFFLCPHHPDEQCGCRKPQPGLLQQASAFFDVTLSQSVFVGDAITDYQAAIAAGCQSILVESGRQGRQLHSHFSQDDEYNNNNITAFLSEAPQSQFSNPTTKPPIVRDLSAAVDLILQSPPSSSLLAT